MTIVYFFDDDGKVYLVYGNSTIKIVELKDDLNGVKEKCGTASDY